MRGKNKAEELNIYFKTVVVLVKQRFMEGLFEADTSY
uniref:Uncharacterized protein n=1 Tax=Arundo donax TaxID=35708 RepID=A0A0A9CCR6_ARUDO